MSSNVYSDDFIESSLLATALAGLWRRRVLMTAIVAATLALGIITSLLLPSHYTAEAQIRGEIFAAPDTVAKDESSVKTASSLDLVRVIETQSQLLQSHLIARRVVQQIGLDRLHPLVSKEPFLPTIFFSATTRTREDELDVGAERLLSGLSVTTDPRSYLITVRFTAPDPRLAELVTTGFVVELLRSAKLQMLSKQLSLAQDTLSIQLARYGERHPSVLRAQMRVAATDDFLKQELNASQDVILQAAGENVTKATSSPASRKPLIFLFLFGGLAISVGVALWLERATWLILPSVRPIPST